MKCLQCGTELDRLSKWRGSSDYCSEECKKASQEEFNRLAMSRLMQPRPARAGVRTASSGSRAVESTAGSLTVVTHPVGASAPVVEEPPHAAFIIDIVATLSDSERLQQSPILPRPASPLIPETGFPTPDSLLALEAMLRGIRPDQRGSRRLPPMSLVGFAIPSLQKPDVTLPASALEWPQSLGMIFGVIGLDNVAVSSPATTETSTFQVGSPAEGATPSIAEPVAHRAIPSRRGQRDIPSLNAFATGADYLIAPPTPSAPRLRIHLPKPALQTYRPRYAFAPREVPAAELAVAPGPSEPATPKEIAPEPRPVAQPALAVELKPEPGPERTAEPAQPAAAAAKPEPKKETARSRRVERRAAESPEPAKPVALQPVQVPKPAVAKNEAAKVDAPAPEKKLELVPKPEPRREEPKPEPVAPATFAAPSFGGKADVEPEAGGFFSRMPGWQKAAAAVVVLGAALAAWVVPSYSRGPQTSKAPVATQSSATMGAESWETDSSGDTAGIARRRVISLYKPGRGKRNYVFEFTGNVEQRAMGWVFRMKDPRNYYCLKLEQTGSGASSSVQLVKFAVIDGEEQPHRLVSIAEPLAAGQPVRIRLDVRGQNFSTQVNGRPVDVWIDNQIAEGTVGFSNESGERAVIRSVKVSY